MGGTALAALVLVAEAALAKLQLRLNRRVLAATDARLQCVSQTVKNIKTIKAAGWQAAFLQRIVDARALEVARIRLVALVRALIFMLLQATPILVSLCTFAIYAATSERALTAVQVCGIFSLDGLCVVCFVAIVPGIHLVFLVHSRPLRRSRSLRCCARR